MRLQNLTFDKFDIFGFVLSAPSSVKSLNCRHSFTLFRLERLQINKLHFKSRYIFLLIWFYAYICC